MSRNCPLREPIPDQALVRAMRKGRSPRAKATRARTLYAVGLCVEEVAEAMKWEKNQVVQALRRIP